MARLTGAAVIVWAFLHALAHPLADSSSSKVSVAAESVADGAAQTTGAASPFLSRAFGELFDGIYYYGVVPVLWGVAATVLVALVLRGLGGVRRAFAFA